MLVIFDCDGVLVDSEVLYCAIDAAVLADLGVAMAPAELTRRFGQNMTRVVSGDTTVAPAAAPSLFRLLLARIRRWFGVSS